MNFKIVIAFFALIAQITVQAQTQETDRKEVCIDAKVSAIFAISNISYFKCVVISGLDYVNQCFLGVIGCIPFQIPVHMAVHSDCPQDMALLFQAEFKNLPAPSLFSECSNEPATISWKSRGPFCKAQTTQDLSLSDEISPPPHRQTTWFKQFFGKLRQTTKCLSGIWVILVQNLKKFYELSHLI